jgi:fructose/tagatose bisphosphate aldolase
LFCRKGFITNKEKKHLKHFLIDSTFEYISANREQYNPGKIDKVAREAIIKRIYYWIELLGCAGKA